MPVDENNPNLERGEFRIIQQLVKYLPGGKKIKQEVCQVIRKVAMFWYNERVLITSLITSLVKALLKENKSKTKDRRELVYYFIYRGRKKVLCGGC